MEKRKPELLLPGEVAKLFRVDVKTVGRWAQQGKLNRIKTPGGHGRYYRVEVMMLLNDEDRGYRTNG